MLYAFGFLGFSCFSICAIISLFIGIAWLSNDWNWQFDGWVNLGIPVVLIIWLLMISIMIAMIQEGQVLGRTSAYVLYAFLFYFYAHLGISLVISSIIRTPGCEMRAIPHLYTLVTGDKTKEHFCPGLFNDLDKWERDRSGPRTVDEEA